MASRTQDEETGSFCCDCREKLEVLSFLPGTQDLGDSLPGGFVNCEVPQKAPASGRNLPHFSVPGHQAPVRPLALPDAQKA